MADADWWRDGVLYQVYVRSFADTTGDGVGDLRGVIARLDHLAWLGVSGIWLSPVTVSPNADWGYDVADYRDVDPAYGSLSDLDELVRVAGDRGIRVLLDLVPNHTSDRHPWFVDARRSRTARHRDWYVWADPAPDGGPPNNWVSSFGGPAWTFDDRTGQYYLHNFLPEQPDLNWWNEQVRAEFDTILRFWFDRGVAGVRIDVCHGIVKDALLRDNPPATAQDHWLARMHGQRPQFNANRPEVHDVLRRWRRLAEGYRPARLLLGETYVFDLAALAGFYGAGDELQLAFNFPFVFAAFEPAALRDVVQATERALPAGAWPVWNGSSHDISRFPSRWAGGDPARIRLALMLLLTLRGTPVLYYGDEIGLPDTALTETDLRDPVGRRYWPVTTGRDPERTPMPWSPGPGAGFTDPAVRPWLPVDARAGGTVAEQQADPGSVLRLTRDLIALRRATPDLTGGDYRTVPAPPGVWAWHRGRGSAVALNLSGVPADVRLGPGRVAVGTDRRRDGDRVPARLTLGPWEGVVLRLDPEPAAPS